MPETKELKEHQKQLIEDSVSVKPGGWVTLSSGIQVFYDFNEGDKGRCWKEGNVYVAHIYAPHFRNLTFSSMEEAKAYVEDNYQKYILSFIELKPSSLETRIRNEIKELEKEDARLEKLESKKDQNEFGYAIKRNAVLNKINVLQKILN